MGYMKKIITTLGIVGTLFIGANLASANHLSGSYYVIPTYSSYTYTTGCNTYRYDPYYKTSTLISSTCAVSTYNSYNYGYSYPATTYSYSYPTTNYSYYNGYSNYGVSNYSPYDNYNYTYSNYGYNSNSYYNNTYSSYPYNYYGNSYYSAPTYQYWYNYTNGYPTSIQNVAPPVINWNSSNYNYGTNYYPSTNARLIGDCYYEGVGMTSCY
jgi:hypothetical protein